MRIDLESALADVAASVDDGATADRMSGQVRHMVGRIRRRRAARHATTGVVGVGAAAAVVVAAVQLTDGGPERAPVAESPTPTPTGPAAEEFGVCGSTVVDPMPGADPVVSVQGTVSPTADARVARVSTTYTDDARDPAFASGSVDDPVVVLARDGVVVSPVGTLTGIAESYPPQYGFELPLVSCEDGTALRDGDYEVFARQGFTAPDGETLDVLGGPWPVTLPLAPGSTDDPDAPVTDEPPTDAAAQIDAWRTSPVDSGGVFPVCGSEAFLDDGMPILELDYLVDGSALLPGGETLPDAVALKTTLGRYAIGNASPLARVVLIQDGIVVGYQFLDTEDLTTFDLSDGQTQVFPLRTTTTLCGTGEGGQGEPLPLPPGEYVAIAALDLLVKETGGPGEEPDGRTWPATAVSEALRITLP